MDKLKLIFFMVLLFAFLGVMIFFIGQSLFTNLLGATIGLAVFALILILFFVLLILKVR